MGSSNVAHCRNSSCVKTLHSGDDGLAYVVSRHRKPRGANPAQPFKEVLWLRNSRNQREVKVRVRVDECGHDRGVGRVYPRHRPAGNAH